MRRLLLLLAFVPLIAFPYGPLFPWSPWKPGYTHLALKRADVYSPAGKPLPAAYKRIDDIIGQSETFHRLSVTKRICVVACDNWSDFSRFMPFTGRPGAVTLATGTVIYVTPRIAERGLDAGEFLRHEISHATIHQNQSLLNAYRIGKDEWLSEGIAVWFGNQKAYNTREQFLGYVRARPVAELLDPAQRLKDFDIRYGYVAWRDFDQYLVATKGRDAFQSYLRACMANPRDWRDQFPKSFGATFGAAVGNYQRALRSGSWLPK